MEKLREKLNLAFEIWFQIIEAMTMTNVGLKELVREVGLLKIRENFFTGLDRVEEQLVEIATRHSIPQDMENCDFQSIAIGLISRYAHETTWKYIQSEGFTNSEIQVLIIQLRRLLNSSIIGKPSPEHTPEILTILKRQSHLIS